MTQVKVYRPKALEESFVRIALEESMSGVLVSVVDENGRRLACLGVIDEKGLTLQSHVPEIGLRVTSEGYIWVRQAGNLDGYLRR